MQRRVIQLFPLATDFLGNLELQFTHRPKHWVLSMSVKLGADVRGSAGWEKEGIKKCCGSPG